jgi:hypothetical protein
MNRMFALIFCITLMVSTIYAAQDNHEALEQQITLLQQQTLALQKQLTQMQAQLNQQKHTKAKSHSIPHTKMPLDNATKSSKTPKVRAKLKKHRLSQPPINYHNEPVYVHSLNHHPEAVEYNPEALLADGHVVTYISGTPVVTAPYLGSRPAFDGSDYIVNISSINRDVRLMQQRRKLYQAYHVMGYPGPDTPVIALSGKAEPTATINDAYAQDVSADWDLSSAELAAAASLNKKVEAFVTLDYDPSPVAFTNQRVANSNVGMGLGFINIGDLDESPLYLTAGQIYVPFGRFSSTMISAPLTTILSRTKAMPVILGYQSQGSEGPFAAIYAFQGDTTLHSAAGGFNLGYTYNMGRFNGEFGASLMSSMNNSNGMQSNGANPGFFGGFSSFTNGSEAVKSIPAISLHGILRFDRYNFTAEWIGTSQAFRTQDLSFNGHGAKPQALQLEAGATFMAFSKPASVAVGYQWSQQALALRLPRNRLSGIFNISIWKDTVESIEFRHDMDYRSGQFANGAAPSGVINNPIFGSGRSANTLLAQIGVYF